MSLARDMITARVAHVEEAMSDILEILKDESLSDREKVDLNNEREIRQADLDFLDLLSAQID